MSPGVSAGKRKRSGGRVPTVLSAALVLLLLPLLLAPGPACRRGDDAPAGADSKAVAESPPGGEAGGTGQTAKPGDRRKGGSGTGKSEGKKGPAGDAKTRGASRKGGTKGKGGAPAIPPPAVAVVVPAERLTTDQIRDEVAALREESGRLQSSVVALTPSDPYILINTTLNRLSLKAGDRYILQDAFISTGSNTELVEQSGRRRWFFSTPKGVHVVKRKMVSPIWVKPDWAFIEENEPVPGAQAEARFEEGMLGRYALYFGNGYMIHGTPFQRFLGQSVTHGCVRVGDADLETVYQNSSVGTKIYIY